MVFSLAACGPSKILQHDSSSLNRSEEVPAHPHTGNTVSGSLEGDVASESICLFILFGAVAVSCVIAAFCYPSRLISLRNWTSHQLSLLWLKLRALKKK
jgi:hypothetical protein